MYTLEQRWEILRQIDLQKMSILANKVIFSDEAHFDFSGYVNCRSCGRGIIGSFFFKNEQGEAVTVNDDRYRAMLNEFLFTKIEEEDIDSI